jgi:hypothetical protein
MLLSWVQTVITKFMGIICATSWNKHDRSNSQHAAFFCGTHSHLHLILPLVRNIHCQDNFLKSKTANHPINYVNLCGSFPRRLHFTLLTLFMHTFVFYIWKPKKTISSFYLVLQNSFVDQY